MEALPMLASPYITCELLKSSDTLSYRVAKYHMGISDNYTLQAENLGYLTDVIEELQSVSLSNTRLKNEIVESVDSSIRKSNGNYEDHSQAISQLNTFLRQYYGNEEPTQGLTQEQELRAQNGRLRELLQSKVQYNNQLSQLNNDYESSISDVMSQIRDLKEGYNYVKFQKLRESQTEIQEVQKREADAYLLLLRNEEIVHKLVATMSGFYEYLEDNRYNDESANELKYMLEWYSKRYRITGAK